MTTDQRLERMEQAIADLAQSTDQRFDRMEKSIADLARTTDQRFDRMEKSIADLAGGVQNLTRYVLELRTETANHLEIIENRLEVLGVTVATLDSRMPPLAKAIMDFGVVATRLQREQTRVARLVEPAA